MTKNEVPQLAAAGLATGGADQPAPSGSVVQPDRWFDTDGRYPYERTEREVREKTQYGEEGRLYTRVSYEPDGLYAIHVGGNPREWVLDDLRRIIEADLAAVEPSNDPAKQARRKMTFDLYDALPLHESLGSLKATLLLGEFGDELKARARVAKEAERS